MTGEDTLRRPADTRWRHAGPGFNPTMKCWFCNQPRGQLGSRRVGPLRLFKCAQCMERSA
jgi:hypothetical protein